MSGLNEGIIEKIFEKIRRLEPSEQSQEQAIQKVRERLVESENQKANAAFNAVRIIMRSPITKFAAAAVIIIVIFVCMHQFGGAIDGTSLAWADVVEKLENDIKSTNTIHVLLTMRMTETKQGKPADAEAVEPDIIKGELWLRRNPFAGKFVLGGAQTNYFTENKVVHLDHHGKKWFEQSITKEKTGKNMYEMFDALVTGDFKTHQKITGFSISDGQIIGSETIAGEKATIYQFICTPSKEKKQEGQRTIYFKCWVRDSDHRTVRLQMHLGDPDKFDVTYDLIEYDVTIPPGTFDVVIPEGYDRQFSQEEIIRITIPKNVIKLKEAYDIARMTFPNYRMVILNDAGHVENRVVKEDEKWRIDAYRWLKNNNQLPQWNDFEDLWEQIEKLKEKLMVTEMTYQGKIARGSWPRKDLGYVANSTYYEYRDITDELYSLEYTAWPKMYINSINGKVKLLPVSEMHPLCMGVSIDDKHNGITELDIPPIAKLETFWIDPTKDYICVRYEQHQRPEAIWQKDEQWEQHEPTSNILDGAEYFYTQIVETTELAQTENGKWYPKVIKIQHYYVNRDGTRATFSPEAKIKTIYIDTQGPIDPKIFEWPAELPPPSN